MPKRPASPHPPDEQQGSKKPKLDNTAEPDSSMPTAVGHVSQPPDVVEDEDHSLDERMEVVSGISDHWLERPVADYLPEHAYPANGKGDVLEWPFALLEALLELSRVTAGQDKDLRSRLAGAFASAKRYSLTRSLKSIKAVRDSFTKEDSTKPSNGEPSVEGHTNDGVAGSKPKKTETKRKAGEGFTPWKPKPAFVDIPKVQPHWGIVPRSGGYRPSELQPCARESDAAVRPPLWENRKGAVRIKRGSRSIRDYDQAFHMWLPLMDMRPISRKNQAPKRKPVAYYYEHGMPTDWNDVAPLNDLNKALQEAIKAKSNKEASFTAVERTALARLCDENQEASIWDIAEQFNDQVHPVNASEDGQYPKGRFIESICHEYLLYKSTYDKGIAPTDATEKDTPLEKIYASMKSDSPQKKASPKKDKVSKTLSSPKMSDTAGVTKKRAPKKTTKKPNSDQSVAPSDGGVQKPSDPTVPVSEQPPLSQDDEIILDAAGAYSIEDVRPSSPMSATSQAVVDSPSYGSKTAAIEQEKEAQVLQAPDESHEPRKASLPDDSVVPSNALSGPVGTEQDEKTVDTNQYQAIVAETQLESRVDAETTDSQTAIQTEIVVQETQTHTAATVGESVAVSQYATANTMVKSTFVENAVRNTQVDEIYADDDDLD